MEVRKCEATDLPLLAQWNRCLIEDEGSDNPMNEEELLERMKGFLDTEYEAHLFIVDGDIVGYALVRNTVQPLYLRQFYIDRQYRRMHYGEQAFLALLRLLNVQTIDVEVLTRNETGIQFWEKMNFYERSKYMRYGEK